MDAENLKRVHDRLLTMADCAVALFEREGIRYSIAYGTLLGAVRHKGFVPWDDDLDLYVFDEDYDRALELLRRELPGDMIVHDRMTDPIYWKAWSCIRDLTTDVNHSLHDADNAFRYQGLTIDLFRLKKMPRREFEAYLHRENIEFLVRKLDSGTMEESEYRARLDAAVTAYAGELGKLAAGEGDVTPCFGFLIYGFVAPEDCVLPLRRYEFEGRQYWGPNDYDAVLTRYYGDYMTLPAPEKRIPHYDRVDFIG